MQYSALINRAIAVQLDHQKAKIDETPAAVITTIHQNAIQCEWAKKVEDPLDKRVMLNGHLDVPSGRLIAVREALPDHIKLTRAEKGCIFFEVVEDETQPGRFLVSEIFENQEAFDAHQHRTRNSDWFNVTKGIPRDYSITKAADENTQK